MQTPRYPKPPKPLTASLGGLSCSVWHGLARILARQAVVAQRRTAIPYGCPGPDVLAGLAPSHFIVCRNFSNASRCAAIVVAGPVALKYHAPSGVSTIAEEKGTFSNGI